MKIWHQSFTVLDHLGAYHDALKSHFARVARPGTEIVLHGMHPGTYRSNYPGSDIRHAALQYIHGLQFMKAAVQAQQEHYDVYAISTLPEPALREIRGLVDIPVVAYGESAMLTACMLGRKFGVLVFIDDMNELIAENARGHGLESRFAGAMPVGFSFNDVLKGFEDPSEFIKRFHDAARKLIAAGAEVIIPGEAPMNVLLAQNGVSEIDGVPVLDSLAAWIKQAEAIYDLRALCGTKPCRKGYYHKLPDQDRVNEIFSFYGLNLLQSAT
ncbi:aspartate/glutamate racemase family protein [Candidimonas humi]|uniref:Aspartate/glutamate racemase family protein n=1 Tax=Candidimonas humi TaxID=683355 RepID=A0ABV8NY49_9BURK|nr:aspartate/glutamate racemase family protein [Candidimonas humi]MBV6304777.1 aspartate/glutamate racemase family protein [Candidimonas humi]